jgi:hypothetical protein
MDRRFMISLVFIILGVVTITGNSYNKEHPPAEEDPFMPIPLSLEEQKECYRFATEVVRRRSQSQKHFGGDERPAEHIIADQTEGKMVELILQKFLADKGFPVLVDFDHYDDPLVIDRGDVQPARFKNVDLRLDVKGSSFKAQWLLIEDWKMVDKSRPSGFTSDIYVMVKFTESFPGNKECRKDNSLLLKQAYAGEVVGWATAEMFQAPDGTFWFTYERNSRPYRPRYLPNTIPISRRGLQNYLAKSLGGAAERHEDPYLDVELDAALNYGLPIKWLSQEWDELILRFRGVTR